MLWVFQPTSVTRVLFDGVLATCFGMVRGGNTKGTLLCRTGVGGGVRWRCGRRQKLNYSTERCHVWTSGIGTEMKWISTVLISLFCEGWYSCHTHTTFRPAPHRQLTAPVCHTHNIPSCSPQTTDSPSTVHPPSNISFSCFYSQKSPKLGTVSKSFKSERFTYWPTFHLLTYFSPTDRHSPTDWLFTYWPTFIYWPTFHLLTHIHLPLYKLADHRNTRWIRFLF